MSIREEMVQLKAKIERYESMLERATSDKRKDRLLGFITAKEVRLHDLNIQLE